MIVIFKHENSQLPIITIEAESVTIKNIAKLLESVPRNYRQRYEFFMSEDAWQLIVKNHWHNNSADLLPMVRNIGYKSIFGYKVNVVDVINIVKEVEPIIEQPKITNAIFEIEV